MAVKPVRKEEVQTVPLFFVSFDKSQEEAQSLAC